MLSRSRIVRSIERAYEKLDFSWKVLTASPNTDHEFGKKLISVQQCLIDALWILDAQYREIIQEKNRLIARKRNYNVRWFKQRMAMLDKYRKGVKSAIGIGKSIGDGYAWIFYRNEFGLIEHHLKCQRQIHLPPGVGGVGERAFIEKAQGFSNHFVLYHGITSFLRLGDISFIDIKTGRVNSIGELKSEKVGQDQYQITLACVYGRDFQIPPLKETPQCETVRREMPLAIKARLSRQIDQITRAFKSVRKEISEKISVSGYAHFDELARAIEKSRIIGSSFERAGNSMVIGAVRLEGEKLSTRLLDSGHDVDKKIDGAIGAAVLDITDKSLPDNSLFISDVGFDTDGLPIFLNGAVPMFWWPVERSVRRELIFGNVVVMTIHNPAHFLAMLRERRFTVTFNRRSRVVSARKYDGKRNIELYNLDYFSALTRSFLISDGSVLKMLEEALASVAEQKFPEPTKIVMTPIVRFGPQVFEGD